MAAAKYAEPPLAPGEKKYDVFISHCKRIGSTEDRALWIQDTLEEAGLQAFFDRSSLEEISKVQLERDVLASRCLVTVLDPETFTSDWVVFENETATAAGIPIVPFYDADAYAFSQHIQQWKDKHPDFFAMAPIEYHKASHKEARKQLVATTRQYRAAASGGGGGGGGGGGSSGTTAAVGGAGAPEPAPAAPGAFDVYVSYSREATPSGDRALWIQDTLEVVGLRATFDDVDMDGRPDTWSEPAASRRAAIEAKVRQSRCVVTVLHPAAFESELVRLENEVAGEAGVPIIPFLDADTHAWADVAHLQAAHPAVFAVPVIEYRRAYHRQARQLLIAKAKGEKMSGASAALETPAGVLARMLRDLAARMRELTAAGSLPADGAGELCRACEELVGELGRLSAAALDDDAVLDAVSSLRDTVEAVIELVEDAGRPRGGAPSKAGGGCCGGGKGAAVAVAPAPPEPGVTQAFEQHGARIAEHQEELRDAVRAVAEAAGS